MRWWVLRDRRFYPGAAELIPSGRQAPHRAARRMMRGLIEQQARVTVFDERTGMMNTLVSSWGDRQLPFPFDRADRVRPWMMVNERFGKGALVYGNGAADQTSKIVLQREPKVNEF